MIDGMMHLEVVGETKIDVLRLPTPYQTPRLTDEEYGLIMGGNMARLLGLQPSKQDQL